MGHTFEDIEQLTFAQYGILCGSNRVSLSDIQAGYDPDRTKAAIDKHLAKCAKRREKFKQAGR